MPRVVVFRLAEFPLFASLARRVDVGGAFGGLAHFFHDKEDAEHARHLWEVAEPTLPEAVSNDLLTLTAVATEALRRRSTPDSRDTVRFGFHAGLTFEETCDRLRAGGFVVVHAPGVTSSRGAWASDAELEDHVVRVSFDGAACAPSVIASAQAYLRGETTSFAPLDDVIRAELDDGGLGAARFGDAMYAARDVRALLERLLDLHANALPEGVFPQFPTLAPDPLMPYGPIFSGLVTRGISQVELLRCAAFSGFGVAGTPSRAWLAAELLADLEAWIAPLAAAAPEGVADVVERLILDAHPRLRRLGAVAAAVARAPRGTLTSRAAHALLESGVTAAGDAVEAIESRLGVARRDSRASLRDLDGAVIALRGGGASADWGGPGAREALYQPQAGVREPQHLLRATDLGWSPRGDEVVFVVDEVRILRRRVTGRLTCENVAGQLAFEPARDLPPLGKRRSRATDTLLTAHFGDAGRLATGSRDGVLRIGAAEDDPRTHERVATFDEPVFRVRFARRGPAIAAIVGGDLVLLADGRSPRRIGKASTGLEPGRTADPSSHLAHDGVKAYLAWAPDGQHLAVCHDGALVIHDADGAVVRTTRVAGDFEAHGGVGASRRGFFVLRANGLTWVDTNGRSRTIPRAVTPTASDVPGLAEGVGDGRTVLAWTMSAEPDRTPWARLELFDLDRGRAHLVRTVAWNAPVPIVAVSPTLDAYAFTSGGDLWVGVWDLSHPRDDEADAMVLAEALRKRGEVDEARRIAACVGLRAGAPQLLRETERERELSKPPAPTPLGAPMPKPARARDAGAFDLDDDVVHARFGPGTVSDVEGVGAAAKVTVAFEDGVERTLPAASIRRRA